MKLANICTILEAEIIGNTSIGDINVNNVFGCDLMSDVLAFVTPDAMLLTGLTNSQVVRTAEIAEIPVICFVRGKRPQPDTLKLANEKHIPLLSTKLSLFESCGRLHKEGIIGCDNPK